MIDIFGDKLHLEFDPKLTQFPSPEELKYKIFIKVRTDLGR